MTTRNRIAKGSAIMAAAVALIGAWEGLRTTAYRDVVGIPTVCFGETRGVKMGDKYTVEECKAMLGDAIIEFETGMRKCLTTPDKIPEKTYVAFLSLAYNIGNGAFCNSSVKRYANAGQYQAACSSILLYNKARVSGKLQVVKGLDNRRKDEYNICISGLKGS